MPDYRAELIAGVKGLRIGVLRHLYEADVPVPAALKAALDQAYDVLRGLGAVIEDARIRPAADYHAVKITGAESELFAVHEPVLRARLNDFGADFLGRALGALLISGADYVQASRQRRAMIAEMAPLYNALRCAADSRTRPGGPPGCLADDPLLAAEFRYDTVQRDRRPRARAVHRLHR